jgi:hypothetical protein
MKLMVIEGGGGEGGAALLERIPARSNAAAVHAEARRRIHLCGYDAWRVREFATDAAMPKAIRYLQMQITFAAEALVRLEPIPDDFRADAYWPVG